MIVYTKLDKLLILRGISKSKLTEDTGLSTNIVSKISKNEGFKTETINRLCEYLKVQPGEIMEWIPDDEWEKQKENEKNKQRQEIERQIQELKNKLKQI